MFHLCAQSYQRLASTEYGNCSVAGRGIEQKNVNFIEFILNFLKHWPRNSPETYSCPRLISKPVHLHCNRSNKIWNSRSTVASVSNSKCEEPLECRNFPICPLQAGSHQAPNVYGRPIATSHCSTDLFRSLSYGFVSLWSKEKRKIQ